MKEEDSFRSLERMERGKMERKTENKKGKEERK